MMMIPRVGEQDMMLFQSLNTDKIFSIIFKLHDFTEFMKEKVGDKGAPYEEILNQLPLDEPRLILCNFEFQSDDNPSLTLSKLIKIFWCPFNAKANDKFKMATYIDQINTQFKVLKEIYVI